MKNQKVAIFSAALVLGLGFLGFQTLKGRAKAPSKTTSASSAVEETPPLTSATLPKSQITTGPVGKNVRLDSFQPQSMGLSSLKREMQAGQKTKAGDDARVSALAAIEEFKQLRQKALKTPEETAAWNDAMKSEGFLKDVAKLIAPGTEKLEVRMEGVQVLISALKSNPRGPVKGTVLSLLEDNRVDDLKLEAVVRQGAAEDRAELLFHFLAAYPDMKPRLQGKLAGANGKTIFSAVTNEMALNIAASQADAAHYRNGH